MKLFDFDDRYRLKGFQSVAGVDEAGRGPWAGPVVAAAVILPAEARIEGLNDSKKLTEFSREKIFNLINERALAVGVAVVGQEVIDSVNILQATYTAMRQALDKLALVPDLVLVDGWPLPGIRFKQENIIGGDAKSASIAAASVIAKVTRDGIMRDISLKYPQYDFARHKGYGTKRHKEALEKYGPCPVHRKSFSPVRELVSRGAEGEAVL